MSMRGIEAGEGLIEIKLSLRESMPNLTGSVAFVRALKEWVISLTARAGHPRWQARRLPSHC
jgi:hypothetical protein